jgi:hypothetical protein
MPPLFLITMGALGQPPSSTPPCSNQESAVISSFSSIMKAPDCPFLILQKLLFQKAPFMKFEPFNTSSTPTEPLD